MAASAEAAERAAEAIAARLRAAGHQAYLVGGCVRDLLLGRVPADFDIATSAIPSQVLELFPRSYAVGAQFGVVLVVSAAEDRQDAAEREAQIVAGSDRGPAEILTEVATFRSDHGYSDGRRPDRVAFSSSAEQDVERRDFTINGMLLDPVRLAALRKSKDSKNLREAVIDMVGGLADLSAGIVRAIGDPRLRFAEDKLRMLRAVRFAARFGFALDAATAAAIREQAATVAQVSRERIRDELTKMLTEGHARRAFELLEQTGLLARVLPEIERMKGVSQPPQFHPEGDVWLHTLLLLQQLPEGCSPELAWGALLHDVGKPATFRVAPDRIRFDGHVEVGVRIAGEICRRLRFSNESAERILALVENHMRFADVPKMKESTLRRFFRLPVFPEHLALHKMDCLASHGSLDHYEFAKERFESLPAEQVRPALLVTGKDLIAAGYRPGPEFKKLLALAEDAQLEGRIHTREEGLALLRSERPQEHFS
ncbi:MAG TPA: CCA tRNA nucleotidyltransferase [Acidobacteriaceae bacterium]|nr:CCA tRNA nucleotidyltransferase [Acidobacteriaceae bacterium]